LCVIVRDDDAESEEVECDEVSVLLSPQVVHLEGFVGIHRTSRGAEEELPHIRTWRMTSCRTEEIGSVRGRWRERERESTPGI
jgi:hypothetical protein